MATKERRGGLGKALGVFALGATAGSIVALLYAPASGAVTRKRLKLKFKSVQKSAIELRNTAAKRIGDARTWVTAHMPNGNGRRHQAVH